MDLPCASARASPHAAKPSLALIIIWQQSPAVNANGLRRPRCGRRKKDTPCFRRKRREGPGTTLRAHDTRRTAFATGTTCHMCRHMKMTTGKATDVGREERRLLRVL